MSDELTVVDLFCGAGGFSEGFRQMGFRVVAAVDIWPHAVETLNWNHGEGVARRADLMDVVPRDLPRPDVLIGSPPCTHFSMANRGGGGDLDEGLILVRRFLWFVVKLRPRWWVMENVPRVFDLIGPNIPYRHLGIHKSGSLAISSRMLLRSDSFGVPQTRLRCFVGKFPIPTSAGRTPLTLRDVLSGLTDPESPPAKAVRDPIYALSIPAESLTEHFGQPVQLDSDEVDQTRANKEKHRWYGRMSFPDDLDRPARTIVATQIRASRETVVVPGREGYRRLTVREASSLQGFPITYQWIAPSIGIKHRLVGNAVAPPVAAAIARAILQEVGRRVPSSPHVASNVRPAPVRTQATEGTRRPNLLRPFHLPLDVAAARELRVELDNGGRGRRTHPGLRGPRGGTREHLVRWRCVVYEGPPKSLSIKEFRIVAARQQARGLLRQPAKRARFARMVKAIGHLERKMPDSSTLQAVWARRHEGALGPHWLLGELSRIVDRAFPAPSHSVRERFVAATYACALVAKLADTAGASLNGAMYIPEGSLRREMTAARRNQKRR